MRSLVASGSCFISVLLGACATDGASESSSESRAAYALVAGSGSPAPAVEIRRTAFGVPHIRAADEAGIGFGLGYAYAEDNMCLLAESAVTSRGERSKYFGPDAEYDPTEASSIQMLINATVVPPPRNNLASDFYYKYVNEDGPVRASWERQPPEIRALVNGYVAGFNRYVTSDEPARAKHPCVGKPWVREISALDLMRFFRRFAVEQSSTLFMAQLYAAAPPGILGAQTGSGGGGSILQQLSGSVAGLGSNGVALGRDATTSGKGLLLANPHFPWHSEFRFFQAHLTIPGKLDVMGATIGGAPLIGLGWNHDVAWTHTVNSSRHFTIFALQLDPLDPTRYFVDGRPHQMQKKTFVVELPQGTATHDFYLTQYGPILSVPSMFEWTAQQAFALRDANLDNDRLLEQWWALDRAHSLNELQESVERIVGLPWFHALAVDRAGDTYYSDVTPVPNVSKAKTGECVPLLYQAFLQQGLVVLSGDRSRCNWDDAPGAPAQGLLPAAQLPKLRRADYVQNSNDSAWMTNPASPLTGYPEIASVEGMELSGRTRYGLAMISERLAGRDGLPGDKFSIDSLQKLAFSNRSPYAPALQSDLQLACGAGGSVVLDDLSVVDLTQACDVLRGWDGSAELHSVGYPLFQMWRHNMLLSGLDYWAVPFDARDPAHTPRGLRVADPLVVYNARKQLGQAHQDLLARGLDYARPWGELQVAVRGDQRIPIHGGESDDVYNVAQTRVLGDGQFDVVLGSSAIWMVSFEGEGEAAGKSPKVQGVLTYSQSSNPASPHFADQTERFSNKEWITFPFTEEEIAADPLLTVRQLQP